MRGSGMQCSGFNMGEWLVSTGREGREERKQLGWRRQGRPHTKHGRVVKSDTAVPFLPMPPLMPMLRVHYVVLHVHFWLVVKVACPPGINYFRTQNLGFRRLILSSSCMYICSSGSVQVQDFRILQRSLFGRESSKPTPVCGSYCCEFFLT